MPTRATLHIAYWVEGKSTPALAKQFGVSKGTIYNWFQLHGIPTRTLGEGVALAQTGKQHSEEWKAAIGKAHRGKRHSAEHNAAVSRSHTGKRCPWLEGELNPTFRAVKERHTWSRSGFREDIGLYVRSRWESNVARVLNLLTARGDIAGWGYETHTFRFEGVQRGPYTYTPDFLVEENDGTQFFYEVKGWLCSKSRSKSKRMEQHHPTVEVRLIGVQEYREWQHLFAGLVDWEA